MKNGSDEKEMQQGVKERRRRVKLGSQANCRSFLAKKLREIDADTTMKPGEKHRLLVNGVAELSKIIERVQRVEDVEAQLRALEQKLDERERAGHA